MARLYFRYATMNAGKSTHLLQLAHSYKQQGKSHIIIAPSIDDRYGIGKVTSRIGIQDEAFAVRNEDNLYDLIKGRYSESDCILVDESQFLTKQQVIQLAKVADELNIKVFCYGLKNDYRNELFEGSQYLLIYADKIEELKCECWYCKDKATMIVKFKDGVPVFEGEQVEIGGNDTYKSVCRKHWMEFRNEEMGE